MISTSRGFVKYVTDMQYVDCVTVANTHLPKSFYLQKLYYYGSNLRHFHFKFFDIYTSRNIKHIQCLYTYTINTEFHHIYTCTSLYLIHRKSNIPFYRYCQFLLQGAQMKAAKTRLKLGIHIVYKELSTYSRFGLFF